MISSQPKIGIGSSAWTIFFHLYPKIKPMFPSVLGIFLVQDKVVLLVNDHGSQNVVNQESQGYIHGRVFLEIFLKTNIVI